MDKKPKEAIEIIKKETKNYYKGKNMIPRYVIIGFLFILIVLQFILPKQNKEIIDDQKPIENQVLFETKTISFLENEINLIEEQESFDFAIASINYNKDNIKIAYKKSLSYLPELNKVLIEEGIPTDFKYLIFLDNLKNLVWPINIEAKEKYGIRIDNDVDQSLDYKITTNASIEYIKDLYKDFGDWNLVIMAYFMGSDELKASMISQDERDFENIYFQDRFLDKYFKTMAYKYIIENISDYIDTKNIIKYPDIETDVIKLGETKDLIKRSQKAGYNFKKIKEINPWILGNSLPKGKREIIIEH